MSDITNLLMLVAFISGILLLLYLQPETSFATIGMKMQRATQAQWSLNEFLRMKQNRWKVNKYYSFSEETVRSLGHRFVGRFDAAILHWANAPVLDAIVEYKFPVNHLPSQSRPEDVFQAGLYALALRESGVSCSSTRLVVIYCLQEKAKRCVRKGSTRECWRCRNGKVFVTRFKPKNVLRGLKRLDEVWYEGRKPRPAKESSRCKVCPYSRDMCNYSVV